MSAQDWPVAIRIVDLQDRLEPLPDVAPYPWVRVYVTDAGELIGRVDIRNAHRPVTRTRLAQAIAEQLSDVIASRGTARALTANAPAPAPALPTDVAVSIVVPTCDRPADLRTCLASLCRQLRKRPFEIVVVDNRPSSDAARTVCRDFPAVRLVGEPRPGLSYARNAGFVAARGDLVVATDDDVVAPDGWIERLIEPFVRPEVSAVTGNVLPLELETEAQCRFEAYGGLGRGFTKIEGDRRWFDGMRGAVPTWQLGATANAAFRVSALRDPRVGLLDPALGAGTPTGCSEDTYLFYRILKAGGTIVYEPGAYVWHRHRRTLDALRHQIYAYSKGHAAYHLTTLVDEGDRRALVRLFWSLPRVYARRAYQRVRGRSDYPLSLIALEVAGSLAGPVALWQSRRRVRALGGGASFADGVPLTGASSGTGSHHAVSLESPRAQGPAS